MLTAVNEKNQIIHAPDWYEREKRDLSKSQLFCPSCHNPVFLKSGPLKQAHFAHYHLTNCNVFSEGETEEHLIGKSILYHWFKRQHIPCQLEPYLPSLQQRPDLLIWKKETVPIAIEFQCSSLPAQRMVERTKNYQRNGYDVYWVLGKKFELSDKLTSFQRLFIRKTNKLNFFLLSLDSLPQNLTIFFNIHQKSVKKDIISSRKVFELHDPVVTLQGILESLKKEDQLPARRDSAEYQQNLIESHNLLNTKRHYQEAEMVNFQRYIYRNGHSLISLPLEVYVMSKNSLMIKSLSYFWQYLFLEWLMKKELGEIVTKREFRNQFNRMARSKQLIFYTMPFIGQEEKAKIMNSYLNFLTDRGILKVVSAYEWVISGRPYYYKTESEKLKDFHSLENKNLFYKN